MSLGSFVRFVYKAEILRKTTITNDAGQKFPSWTADEEEAACYATPASMRSSIRATPTAEHGDWLTFYLPSKTTATYGTRVQNIKYRQTMLYDGPYEIQDIKGMNGFSGKIEYYEISLKRVIE